MSEPPYPRLLQLKHVHPNAWQRAVLGEGMAGVGVLLAMIALGPLFFPKWWAKHYPKVVFSLGALTLAYYLIGLQFALPVKLRSLVLCPECARQRYRRQGDQQPVLAEKMVSHRCSPSFIKTLRHVTL